MAWTGRTSSACSNAGAKWESPLSGLLASSRRGRCAVGVEMEDSAATTDASSTPATPPSIKRRFSVDPHLLVALAAGPPGSPGAAKDTIGSEMCACLRSVASAGCNSGAIVAVSGCACEAAARWAAGLMEAWASRKSSRITCVPFPRPIAAPQ
eukprot:3858692-Pyramimonas_sp.AAC.2